MNTMIKAGKGNEAASFIYSGRRFDWAARLKSPTRFAGGGVKSHDAVAVGPEYRDVQRIRVGTGTMLILGKPVLPELSAVIERERRNTASGASPLIFESDKERTVAECDHGRGAYPLASSVFPDRRSSSYVEAIKPAVVSAKIKSRSL
jgi:hypothetical protein